MSDDLVLSWDKVYEVWAYECQQSDQKTAERTGIPRRTIAYHRGQEGWQDRFISAHYGISEQDLNLARIELRSLAKEGMQRRLRSIILDEVPVLDMMTGDPVLGEDGQPVMKWRASDKDAVAAMRVVTEYALDSARDSGLATPIPASFKVRSSNGDLSPQDQAIAILEDNAAAVNTRIRKGKRT